MEDRNLGQDPDDERCPQVRTIAGTSTEVEPKEECRNSGEQENSELHGADEPAVRMRQAAQKTLNVKLNLESKHES